MHVLNITSTTTANTFLTLPRWTTINAPKEDTITAPSGEDIGPVLNDSDSKDEIKIDTPPPMSMLLKAANVDNMEDENGMDLDPLIPYTDTEIRSGADKQAYGRNLFERLDVPNNPEAESDPSQERKPSTTQNLPQNSKSSDDKTETPSIPPRRRPSKALCECMYPPVVIEHPDLISQQIATLRRRIADLTYNLFPTLKTFTIEEDNETLLSASDSADEWPVHQIFVLNQSRQRVAEGEFVADIPGAYQSLQNVLKEEVVEHGLPFKGEGLLDWGRVCEYAGMKCSGCGQLRPCMGSAREWSKELRRRYR